MKFLARIFIPDKFTTSNYKDMVSHASTGVLSSLFLLLHSCFLIYYVYIGNVPMILVSVGSISIYISSISLTRHNCWRVSALLIVLEVSLYCIATVFFVGWDAGAQGYLPVVMFPVLILIHASTSQKILHIALLCTSMATCYLLRLYVPPISAMESLAVMEAINLFICMSAALLTVGMSIMSTQITENLYQGRIEDLTGAANRDTLTGLWNRRYASRTLDELFGDPTRREQSFLAMLDIDFFKNINDNYGHDIGDVVLTQLSNVIQDNLPSTDLVARWGGEEFLLLLQDTNHIGAYKALDTLRTKVQDTVFCAGSHQLRLTITVGFCSCAGSGSGADYAQYLRRSDEALYHGKSSGRNIIVNYDATLDLTAL